MANLSDVAKHAGVGVGTVSRYINNSGYVSIESRNKIAQAIKELDYTPNELARNLYHNRTKIIGIMLPNIEHPFFSKFLRYVELELYKRDYKLVVCNAVDISRRQKDFLDLLERNMLDGLITGIDKWEDSRIEKIKKPIVSLDRNWGDSIPVVHSDHTQSGLLLAEHILKAGCKRLVHFASSGHDNEPFSLRDHILQKKLQEHNVEITHVELKWNMMDYEYLNSIVEEYMDILSFCDTIFGTDIIAVSCLNIANKKGIQVPQQLKLISNDGMDITRLTYPVIASVLQNVPLLAKTCVQTLMDMIEGVESIPHEQIVPVGFQEGGTL